MRPVCAFLLLGLSTSHSAWAQVDETLTTARAAGKVGQTVAVVLKVKAIGKSTGGFADLVSEGSAQHPDAFIVRISPEAQEKFAERKIADAGRHFRQQFVRVTGRVIIVNYNTGKRPVIEVQSPSQIEVVDPDTLHAAGEELLALYKSTKLFQRSAYKEVRAAFARRFETVHEADLKKAYGEDFEELTDWFAKNPEVKENFYTALVERHDDVLRALGLFKELWKRHPGALAKWNQLAIATALTWDEDRGVYDYKPHQTRVQGVLPEGATDALDNFKYIVDNEKRMPQPVALYPWEFLTFVVNHRTPLAERTWAHGYYQTAKSKKSLHAEVPYDFGIIRREINQDPSAKPRLAGRDYTLANLKVHGGVCAHQADFACRVAQSVGIPAVYCSGASAYRDHHAWWMYVSITSATKDEIKFVLHSDGRFDGKDNFFTGQVLDPQSGEEILDRDLERRLWAAGSDRVGKRLAALVMRAYPLLTREAKFETKEKVAYLDQCLKVSKYNEDAWLQFAALAKAGELNDDNKRIALSHLASLNQTFVNYPDFVWRVFDDLVEVATEAEKTKQYENVLQQFRKAKRTDLICDARLKLADLQVAQAKHAAALTGLTSTVREFPTEGRYVPRLLKKMEEVAPSVKGGPTQVAQVYTDMIPAMIAFYKSDSNVYYKKTAEQARAFLAQHNLTQAATTLESRIAKARAAANLK